MSDPHISAITDFMAEALTTARAMHPEERDDPEMDELDADCQVVWDTYTKDCWEQIKSTTEGDITTMFYRNTEDEAPGILKIEETNRRGMTAVEIFLPHNTDEFPGQREYHRDDLDDDDDGDGGPMHDYFPCRIERAMRQLIRTRPVVPGSINGPTLTAPTEYVPEEIPKPDEYGDWA